MRGLERFGVALALVVGLAALAASRPGILGPSATARPAASAAADQPFAVCDIIDIVELLMDSERYKPARDEQQAAAQAAVEPLRARVEELQKKGQALQEGDPSLPETAREFQMAQLEFQRRTQELQRELETFTATQLKEAYSVAVASAQAIAEQMGYDYVLASRPVDRDMDAQDTTAVIRSVLARPVLKAPEGVDITPDVKQDLKLD